MCGIAGLFGFRMQPEDLRVLLRQMIEAVGHRGPDGEGFHLDGPAGLAHARLSILDLAAGAQPMCNEDGTVWVTFNGEIFNYVELRDELLARGHRFRTQSDTEVIVHLYEDHGVDCARYLNGDFAFGIWDSRKQELALVRDRMGVRPLFYSHCGQGIAFGSEIKALLQVPGVAAEPDPIALDQIFTFWFPLTPRTPFKGIKELPPAHVLVANLAGDVRIRRYWTLSYPETNDDGFPRVGNPAALEEELYDLFCDATRIRLRSDVPVGAYLSGGFDSSVTTSAIKHMQVGRLRSFSVTFEAEEFDESAFQQEMVDALGTEHASVLCRGSDIAALFPRVIRHAERPVLRSAPAPMMMLSALVREQGFKVVLTGEGADEVFAGYDLFKEAKLRRFCARQPQSRMRPQLLRRLYPYLPALQGQSQRYLEAFFATGDSLDPLHSHMPRFRTTSGAKVFFSGDLKSALAGYDALDDLRSQLPAEFARWHPLSQAQYLETTYLLPSYILSSQGDRMAMANAVEGRFPFLDHRLVEFGARIPAKLRVRALEEKYILRRSLKGLLPDAIANRPKQPYRAPDGHSFVGPRAPGYVAEHLSDGAVNSAGYFEPKAVGRLLAKAQRSPQLGARDHMAFLGVLSTQMWHRQFVAAGGSADFTSSSQKLTQSQDFIDAVTVT